MLAIYSGQGPIPKPSYIWSERQHGACHVLALRTGGKQFTALPSKHIMEFNMRFQTVLATVVETKFEPLQRAHMIALEIGKGVHLCALCPFEHKLKVGDKVPLEIEIPLVLEKVDPVKMWGA